MVALSAVVVATCMLLLDSTAVNVALPPSRLPRSGPMSLQPGEAPMTRAYCAVSADQASPPITLSDWRALRPFGQGPQPFPVALKPREAASTPRRARWASDPSGGKISYR